MIDPDDLNPGDWVVVTHHFTPPGERCGCEFNGRPMRVLAVSLPFVACQSSADEITTVDVRNYGMTRALPDYVEAVTGLTLKPPRRRKPKPEPPDPERCVYCGERFRRQLHTRPDKKKVWLRVCPGCGRRGEQVPCKN